MKRPRSSFMPSPFDFEVVRNLAGVALASLLTSSVASCGSRSVSAGPDASSTGSADGPILGSDVADAAIDSALPFSFSCGDAAAPPGLATSPLCTTFTRDPLFDAIFPSDYGDSHVAGVAGTSAADFYVALNLDFDAQVGRWDGSAWTMEKLPEDPFSIASIAIDTSGEPWAVIAERGSSKSGIGGPSALIHRRNGVWSLEPNPSRFLVSIWGTTSGLFLIAADSITSGERIWGWQDHAWHQIPLVPSARDIAEQASSGASGFWGAGCGQVLAFGGGGTADAPFAALFRPDMTGWASVPAPVPGLAVIEAVSGTSIDDLYVLAVGRNDNVTRSVVHVTNDLQTWTLLSTPPVVDYQTKLWSPRPSVAVALGCEWPDKTRAPAPDCARLTTFTGDMVATAPVPGVEGAPVALWGEPVTGTAHLFTAVPAANGIFRAQHYVAPAECP
jgi:hypothetical protein